MKQPGMPETDLRQQRGLGSFLKSGGHHHGRNGCPAAPELLIGAQPAHGLSSAVFKKIQQAVLHQAVAVNTSGRHVEGLAPDKPPFEALAVQPLEEKVLR